MPTITFRGSRDDLRRLLASVPGVLSGSAPDPLRVARGLQLRLSTALLSQILQEIVTLSRGGTSRDARRWAPLRPATLAKRLAKERKAGKRKGKKKGKGSPYAGRVEIGVDTRRMIRSLTPGVEGEPPTNPDQVVKLGRGELIVGTNVPYARYFHEGRPGKQVPRRLWPADGSIPGVWWPAITAAGLRGVVRAIELMAQDAGR